MKPILPVALALSLLGSVAVLAQQDRPDRSEQGASRSNEQDRDEPSRKRTAAPAPRVQEQNRERAVPAAPRVQVQQQERSRATPAEPRVRDQRRTRVAPAAPKVQEQERERAEAPAPRGQARPRATPDAPRVEEQGRDRATSGPRGPEQDRNRDVRNEPGDRQAATRWSRGDRVPDEYRQNRQYFVEDWRQRGLKRPRSGYRWVRNDRNDFFLAAIATGLVADVLYRDQWDQQWSRRYSRPYAYDDDVYYQECRTSPDPAGVIAGALIGGLLGSAAGQGGGQQGATIAGVIIGGTVGAALTRELDCDDRSYAYRTYYDGFNSGQPGSRYAWRNPRNDHRGEFRVRSYYNDPFGFRCANFTQTIYIGGRSRQARGVACRQPDGSWAIVR